MKTTAPRVASALAVLAALLLIGGCSLFGEPTVESRINPGTQVTADQAIAEYREEDAKLRAQAAAIQREFKARIARVQGENALALADLQAEYDQKLESVGTLIELAKARADRTAEELAEKIAQREAALGSISGIIKTVGSVVPGAGAITTPLSAILAAATAGLLWRNGRLKAHAVNLVDAKDAADAATLPGEHDEKYEKVFTEFLTSRTAEFVQAISARKL